MGFIGGLANTALQTGSNGLGAVMGAIGGPQHQVESGTNLNQANTAYNQTQAGLQQQQDFVNALAAQNGVNNQSNVYNQYAQMAAGQGPNPAQNMLATATGANVANQAALMASQRGAGSNVGLIARQAAMQGGAQQQQAAGQAALMQAQQQQQALGQMGSLATQQVGQQSGALANYNQFAENQHKNILDAIGGQQRSSAQLAGQEQQARYQLAGNVVGAAGKAAAMADGGEVEANDGPQSFAGKFLKNGPQSMPVMAAQGGQINGEMLAAQGKMVPGKAAVKGDNLKNDTVKALLSPGEIVIPRSIAQGPDAANKAAQFVSAILAKHGKLPAKSAKK